MLNLSWAKGFALGGVGALALALAAPAWGTYGDSPRETVMVCDPTGKLCLIPNAAGGLPGGGGGSGSALPNPLTMTTTNPVIQGGVTPGAATVATNTSRKYLEIYNEGSACRFGYGANPGASGGMPLPPGDFALENVATTTQQIWFYCPQTSQLDITEGQ